MSNTESSAITRFIADAQNPRLEPKLKSEPAQPGSQRLARGTIIPSELNAAAHASARASTAPHLGHDTWFEQFDEIEGLVEDEGADGSDAAIPINVESQVAAAPVARASQAMRAPAEPAMLDPEELEEEPEDAFDDDRAIAAAAAAIVAASPQNLQMTSRPGSVLAHLPVGAVAAMARAQEASPFRAPAHSHAQLAPSHTESTDYLQPITRPRRTWLWLLTVGALAGGAYLAVTELKKDGGSAGIARTPIAKPAVAPSEAAPDPAPAAAAAPVAPVAVAAAPALPLTAGFELPGIPVDTRVVFDGKELGQGPMRVLRLTPGPHRLELVAAAGGEPQLMQIELTADSVTALVAPEAAPEAEAEAIAAVAPEAEAEPTPEAEAEAEAEPAPEAEARPEPRATKREPREPRAPAAPSSRAVAEKTSDSTSKPTPRPLPGKDKGILLVNAKPPCEIIVDGKRTGLVTPQRDLPLKAGTHTVLLVNSEHRIKKSTQVKIVAGKSTRLILDLTDLMR